ncbi:lysophospholipid acyltransferase family protein [Ramlibacter solisilvae]|uniref:Lipid A biosynthesis acyltransferase n=1 Tax=Ramlibacter tataouinensis TaxID=94132 RepID=A0A127JUR7_9BURK|nr:lipid A biosynthesis acyltransferase [Ramlibacter tataouinensis]AMO23746.1 lipid A biosynthesis acyltransferase [Ramlibacter tataouinensis]
MMSRLGILFMRLLAFLPLPLVRALGHALGLLLYLVVVPRRRVVRVNLRLCFPQWSEAQRRQVMRDVFIYVTQSFLDRAWLWHADPEVVRRRVKLTGAVHELAGEAPTILFAPHFVGLDAGVTGVTQQIPRRVIGIYTQQSNKVVDAWVLKGRHRFGIRPRPMNRSEGVREIVSAIREGDLMYLLPDMNFGPEESIFVPFYGVSAATVPSLSRFARLGRAKVVPLVTRLTPEGYEVRVLESWAAFPSADAEADTALMNKRLEGYIDEMPAQYYWVHKRFKTRPPGEPGVY